MRQVLKFIFLLICPMVAMGLPDDTQKRMQITSDTTFFNYKSGLDIYEGHVRVDQGETHLIADKLTTQKNAHHKIEEAIAYGYHQLADYWTIPKVGDKVLHAKAKVIKFYPLQSNVVLEGNVLVTQGTNSFHGPLIVYNIKNQTVTAPPSEKGRATIIIDPKQLTS